MIRYVRNLLVIRTVPASDRVEGMIDAPASELKQMGILADQAGTEELHNLLNMLIRAEGDIRRSSNPWVGLEMTVLRMASAPNILDLSKIIQLMDSRMQAVPKTDKPGGIAATPEKETKDSERRKEATSTGKVNQGKTAPKEKDNESPEDLAVKKVESLRTEAPDELWSIIKERVQLMGGRSGAD